MNKMKEYHAELEAFFEELESDHPEVLGNLEATGNYDLFVMELAMIGERTLRESMVRE